MRNHTQGYVLDLKSYFHDVSLTPAQVDEETLHYLRIYFGLLSNFEPTERDEDGLSYSYWLKIPRGRKEDEHTFKQAKEEIGVKTEEEWEKAFLRFYPCEWEWFSVYAHHALVDGVEYFVIYLGQNSVANLKCDPKEKLDGSPFRRPYFALLSFLIDETRDISDLIYENAYGEYLEKNLPYRYRRGTILLKDYWALCPKARKDYKALYEGIDVEDFVKTLEGGLRPTHFKGMTAKAYFECAKTVFLAIGKRIDPEWTLAEAFRHLGDGRLRGLDEIDQESPEAFKAWFEGQRWGFDHTFEIFPGHSFHRGDLVVEKDKGGYFLCFCCSDFFTQIKVIRGFLALKEQGVVCEIRNPKSYLDRLSGESTLAIVSQEEWLYGYLVVNGMTLLDGMHLPKKGFTKLIKAAKWEPLKALCRKEGGD